MKAIAPPPKEIHISQFEGECIKRALYVINTANFATKRNKDVMRGLTSILDKLMAII